MDLTGQIIVSMPSLQDERFFKTVIYICAHSSDGSMGIIINKKIDYDLYPDLLEQLGIDKSLKNLSSILNNLITISSVRDIFSRTIFLQSIINCFMSFIFTTKKFTK